MIRFVVMLVATLVILIGTLLPGSAAVLAFSHSWWFVALGILLFLVNLAGLVLGLVRRNWASLVSHLGVALLFLAIARDTRSIEITASMSEGETITTYDMQEGDTMRDRVPSQKPLGFALTLVDFREQGLVSRVRLDDGPERSRRVASIAPSHPISHKGWMLLQDRFERLNEHSRFTLLTLTGETLRVTTGERFRVPGRDFELEFDPDFAAARDTMIRFRMFEQGREKATGFLSRRVVMPPSLNPGVKLLDYQLSSRYVSIIQIVRRPGAGLAFAAFLVMLIGLMVLAFKPLAPCHSERSEEPQLREES
jgi:hypothetical protein